MVEDAYVALRRVEPERLGDAEVCPMSHSQPMK